MSDRNSRLSNFKLYFLLVYFGGGGHKIQLFYLDFKGMRIEALNNGHLFKLQEQTEGLEVGKGT